MTSQGAGHDSHVVDIACDPGWVCYGCRVLACAGDVWAMTLRRMKELLTPILARNAKHGYDISIEFPSCVVVTIDGRRIEAPIKKLDEAAIGDVVQAVQSQLDGRPCAGSRRA